MLRKARIRGDHDEVRQLFADNLFTQDRQGIQVVHREVEEALDLGGVQVQRDHTIGSGHFDRIGADTGSDGDPGFVLLVPLGIAKIGHNDRHRLGTGALQRINPEEKFHEIVISRKDGRLHEIHVAPTDIVFDPHEQIPLREAQHFPRPRLHVQVLADLQC